MREEDLLALDFSDLNELPALDRREFLKAVGGGIVIIVALGDLLLAQEHGGRRMGRAPQDFNAFLRIGEDGRVTCFTGKIEMGQGIHTSLAQMLADELETPLDTVTMVMGDTDRCPWDMGTFGSLSTRMFGPVLRRAAAEARQVLKELAAERLEIPIEQLAVKAGVISDRKDTGRSVSFGALARGKRIARKISGKAVLEATADFSVSGKSVKRRDGVEKVTGAAKYTGDIRLPGMQYARILRPPAHGATCKQADTAAAEAMDGVRVVRAGDLIAVLHATPDGAEAALAKITAEWDVPEAKLNEGNIFDHLLSVETKVQVAAAGGDLASGEKSAAQVIESTYLDGYVAHAPIETHTAVAHFEKGRMTVWASTQTPFRARPSVARALGIREKDVRIITPFVGGGFGGKGRNKQVVEAAQLAKAAAVPVHLEWTRAEEFFYDSFRPAAVVKLRAGVTVGGKIAFWDYAVYHAGSRGAAHFYEIPHHRTRVHGSGWSGDTTTHLFDVGAWRAPANNTNTFARESQIDLLAARAGVDPLDFRLRNLKDQRMRTVLEAAAERFGWKPAKAPSGRGWGIACGIDAGSYVAHMAEVAVNRKSGKVEVKRVVCAQDMGVVVNPDGAAMQVEGCVTMGLGYALSEDVRFDGGRIKDLNFDTYKIPRFSSVPEIETVLVKSKIDAPHGGGEPAVICMGGLIANAIFDAVGARVYQMPMTPDRVRAAIEGKG